MFKQCLLATLLCPAAVVADIETMFVDVSSIDCGRLGNNVLVVSSSESGRFGDNVFVVSSRDYRRFGNRPGVRWNINDCTIFGDRVFVCASGAPPFGVCFLSVWIAIYRMIGYGSLNVKPAF